MKVDGGDVVFFTAGISVLLPLGARIAGNKVLARKLDLIPQFFFGAICFLLATLPGMIFYNTDAMDRIISEADPLSGRIIFGAIGIFLFATGIRAIVRRDFDRPDSDD